MNDLDKAIEDIERNVISQDEMENIVQQLQNYKKQNEMIKQEKEKADKEIKERLHDKTFPMFKEVELKTIRHICNKLLNIEEENKLKIGLDIGQGKDESIEITYRRGKK